VFLLTEFPTDGLVPLIANGRHRCRRLWRNGRRRARIAASRF